MGVILITHDLGVMSSLADRLVVMYAGRVAESGPKREVLQAPLHPYTVGLLGSLPQPDGERQIPLVPIPGSPPTADTVPARLCTAPPVPPRRGRVLGKHAGADRPRVASRRVSGRRPRQGH